MDSSRWISMWVVAALACGIFFVLGDRAEGGTPESAAFASPSKKTLKAKLSPQQYSCTQEDGTEPPFANAYWNNHADGVYVDVVSGDPLFSSLDKFDSGTGWPSFTQPLGDSVAQKQDKSLGVSRTEVRSKRANSHLGHVFDDGPGPAGLRYCINSAALRFVPAADLQANNLGRYRFLFAEKLGLQTLTLAGGCFWGMEEMFQSFSGVLETQVGYAGGNTEQASYEQVSTGRTGNAEALQILFDPKKISTDKLLTHFFSIHDPTTKNRQVNDVGTQYRSAIFYSSDSQRATALAMIKRVNASHKWANPVVTQVAPLTSFVRAEDYHQRYLENHPGGYTCHTDRNYEF